MLTADERNEWDRQGFFLRRGFATAHEVTAMEQRIVELARAGEHEQDVGAALLLPEPALDTPDKPLEKRLSKVFRVHRLEPVFRTFATRPAVLALVADLLGEDLDCFLSQFIFKHPGALGQPWHQDAYYFAFDRGPQVGLWLAVTEATLDNGPLWVQPGSHREPVHAVTRDKREHAHRSYVEIVDRRFDGAVPVLLRPGDLLVFHSHLMHRSTDNLSSARRAAMVYHYAAGGTVDQSMERFGFVPPNVDWMPVLRRGVAVPVAV